MLLYETTKDCFKTPQTEAKTGIKKISDPCNKKK
jgi:hypothetical protein